MKVFIVALIILSSPVFSTPCQNFPQENELGTIRCTQSDGTIAAMSSSVYDFRKATCTIAVKDIVTCTNVLVDQTKVVVRLRIDIPNLKSTVF